VCSTDDDASDRAFPLFVLFFLLVVCRRCFKRLCLFCSFFVVVPSLSFVLKETLYNCRQSRQLNTRQRERESDGVNEINVHVDRPLLRCHTDPKNIK
jgi:hypothetical protein